MGEVTADAMGVAVDYGVSILIIPFSATVLIGGSFGFIWCGISTLFLMLNFCAVDFFHQFVYFGSGVLVFCGAVHRFFLYSAHVCNFFLLCCKCIARLKDSIGRFIIESD